MTVLTVPTKLSPYPYAATGIAAYSAKIEILFDDTATSIAFAIDGRTLDDEEAIVHSIAKESNIPDDEEKVVQLLLKICALINISSQRPTSTKPEICAT